jgi:hypothetical protein
VPTGQTHFPHVQRGSRQVFGNPLACTNRLLSTCRRCMITFPSKCQDIHVVLSQRHQLLGHLVRVPTPGQAGQRKANAKLWCIMSIKLHLPLTTVLLLHHLFDSSHFHTPDFLDCKQHFRGRKRGLFCHRCCVPCNQNNCRNLLGV